MTGHQEPQKVGSLRRILIWILRFWYVPSQIGKCYEQVELSQVLKQLGLTKSSQTDLQSVLVDHTGLLTTIKADSNGFVTVNKHLKVGMDIGSLSKGQDQKDQTPFNLDQDRIADLAQVVQFLEKQKHNVTEKVDTILKADPNEEKNR